MSQAFISYSTRDSDFAGLAKITLENKGINVWVDHGNIHPGDDWRSSIDRGIESSDCLIVVLSPSSFESSYVTYEWAYAMGKGKPIIPVLLETTRKHPKLEPLHHLDFTNPRIRPWDELADRVDPAWRNAAPVIPGNNQHAAQQNAHSVAMNRILQHLNAKGFTMISFQKIREKIDQDYTDEFLREVIRQNYNTFRTAILKGKRAGLAKL